MANYLTTDTDLTAVADAIRTKGGTSADLVFPHGFVDAIDAIETGSDEWDFFSHAKPSGTIVTASTGIGQYAAYQRTGITRVEGPNVGSIGTAAFQGCNSLLSVYFPKAILTAYNNSQFRSCSSLSGIVLPKNDMSMPSNAFLDCTNLRYYDSQGVRGQSANGYGKNTGTEVFKNCTNLNVIILRGTSNVTNLNNINVFTGTPFASGKAGGTLYVPSALISSYQSATNWSTIFGYVDGNGDPQNQILPIEGSIYETQYADGTPITT